MTCPRCGSPHRIIRMQRPHLGSRDRWNDRRRGRGGAAKQVHTEVVGLHPRPQHGAFLGTHPYPVRRADRNHKRRAHGGLHDQVQGGDEDAGDAVITFPNTTISDLMEGLSRAGIDTRGKIAVLQAIRAAGALHAEIVVQ